MIPGEQIDPWCRVRLPALSRLRGTRSRYLLLRAHQSPPWPRLATAVFVFCLPAPEGVACSMLSSLCCLVMAAAPRFGTFLKKFLVLPLIGKCQKEEGCAAFYAAWARWRSLAPFSRPWLTGPDYPSSGALFRHPSLLLFMSVCVPTPNLAKPAGPVPGMS